jgi:hypothetical protein
MATVSTFGLAFFKEQSCRLREFSRSYKLLDEKSSSIVEQMVEIFDGEKENQFKSYVLLSSTLPSL